MTTELMTDPSISLTMAGLAIVLCPLLCALMAYRTYTHLHQQRG